MTDKELASRVIEFLNSALTLDRRAISNLVDHRVGCNVALADHPTIQVGTDKSNNTHEVGILGLLNGLCGVVEGGDKDGWGHITAVVENDKVTIREFRLTEEITLEEG